MTIPFFGDKADGFCLAVQKPQFSAAKNKK
jgi:hypothetical protein